MEIKDIKQLIDLMKRYQLTEFELEEQAFKIRLKRESKSSTTSQGRTPPSFVVETPMGLAVGTPALSPASTMLTPPPFPVPSIQPQHLAPVAPAAAPVDEPGVQVIKSPMVGTFYRASGPDAKVFVEEGTAVTPESVICIIEAMKLMNEIHSEVKGTITQILVENGKPVEFGQPLFKVKTA